MGKNKEHRAMQDRKNKSKGSELVHSFIAVCGNVMFDGLALMAVTCVSGARKRWMARSADTCLPGG